MTVARERETPDPRHIVEKVIEALGQGDLGQAISDFADDIVWEVVGGDFIPSGSRYEGKQSVLDDFFVGVVGKVFDLTAPFEMKVRSITADGSTVVAEWTWNARTAQGEDYSNDYRAIFTVDDGWITDVREYSDTEYAKRMLFD